MNDYTKRSTPPHMPKYNIEHALKVTVYNLIFNRANPVDVVEVMKELADRITRATVQS